ncbi:hypothetical protein JW998_17290 [candidate division KSB1 bacterium]|nr:hypothetical protein [candidate division KSB1 bacterium]
MDFAIKGQPVLKLYNFYGGFIIYGQYDKSRIKINAHRRVETTERDKLEKMLSNISIPIRHHHDTLYAHVEVPVPQQNERYSCGLNLFIPYGMPVQIDYVKNDVITHELDSLVYVRNAQSRILLARHCGSADLIAQSHINLEIDTLRPHGFIYAKADSGDINIVLPGNAEATIYAKSFFHPIELTNIYLPQKLTSHYIIDGTIGKGDASIHLETVSGIIRIKID